MIKWISNAEPLDPFRSHRYDRVKEGLVDKGNLFINRPEEMFFFKDLLDNKGRSQSYFRRISLHRKMYS